MDVDAVREVIAASPNPEFLASALRGTDGFSRQHIMDWLGVADLDIIQPILTKLIFAKAVVQSERAYYVTPSFRSLLDSMLATPNESFVRPPEFFKDRDF